MKYLFYTLFIIPFFAKSQDTTAPTIANFWTQDTVLIAVFSDFEAQIPNYSIIDDVDGDITNLAVINHNVNKDLVGFYNFNLEAKDQSNNAFSKTVVIEIADTIAPNIILKGRVWNFIALNDEYIDHGYAVSDNYYPEKELAVITSGYFDKGSQGRYCMSYLAEDASANKSEIYNRIICVALDSMDCVSLPGEICSQVKTGINEGPIKQVGIYPNPSNGKFNLNMNLEFVEVYSTKGQLILTTSEREFEMVETGVYLLKARTKTGAIFTKKLIVY